MSNFTRCLLGTIGLLLLAWTGLQVEAQDQGKAKVPSDYIDPATGHRVIRLSPDSGGSSLYFHQNMYTPKGDKVCFNAKGSIVAVDLTTLGVEPPKAEVIVEGASLLSVSWKTPDAYYRKGKGFGGELLATNVDTKVTRSLGKASGSVVNADETLVFGITNDPQAKEIEAAKAKAEGRPVFDDRLAPRNPNAIAGKLTPGGRSLALSVYNIKTGETKKVHWSTEWLNHLQCSPKDPNLIMFCHEGNWHQVDRIWTIKADGSDLRLMHKRTMLYEIAGHEFPGYDGKWEWYDLQTPRSETFWLAGVNLDTGERIWYSVPRNNWSVHFNVSRDGSVFAGDGGGPSSVAANTGFPNPKKISPPANGQFIHLFRPIKDKYVTVQIGGQPVKIGQFEIERLADLRNHNYSLEPNVTITPDNKWVIFRSNMHGQQHVYAVSTARNDKQ